MCRQRRHPADSSAGTRRRRPRWFRTRSAGQLGQLRPRLDVTFDDLGIERRSSKHRLHGLAHPPPGVVALGASMPGSPERSDRLVPVRIAAVQTRRRHEQLHLQSSYRPALPYEPVVANHIAVALYLGDPSETVGGGAFLVHGDKSVTSDPDVRHRRCSASGTKLSVSSCATNRFINRSASRKSCFRPALLVSSLQIFADLPQYGPTVGLRTIGWPLSSKLKTVRADRPAERRSLPGQFCVPAGAVDRLGVEFLDSKRSCP